jgi:toxin ParE1/3/4
MKITWHDIAKRDLIEIIEHIAKENPKAAHQIYIEIQDQIDILHDFPQAGRLGHVNKTRELVIVRTPFIAVYQIFDAQISILRILHGMRKWP